MSALRDSLLLYAVTAPCAALEQQVEEAVLGGATLVQLREKDLSEADYTALARRIKAVTDRHGVPLIINDSLPVALASNVAGVHIGQEDGNVREARARLGGGKILGVSAQTVEQALAAEADGADYLGVGAVFPTATKPDAAEVPLATLKAICAAVRIPVVAIGGIHAGNVQALAGSGIAGICAVSALFARPGHVRDAACELRALIKTLNLSA